MRIWKIQDLRNRAHQTDLDLFRRRVIISKDWNREGLFEHFNVENLRFGKQSFKIFKYSFSFFKSLNNSILRYLNLLNLDLAFEKLESFEIKFTHPWGWRWYRSYLDRLRSYRWWAWSLDFLILDQIPSSGNHRIGSIVA